MFYEEILEQQVSDRGVRARHDTDNACERVPGSGSCVQGSVARSAAAADSVWTCISEHTRDTADEARAGEGEEIRLFK